MNRPPCPACEAPTQHIFIRDVELDACTACKGLWFDEGELEKVSGERIRFSPLSGGTSRDCPRCAFRMRNGLIQRNLQVEHCRPCMGYFLDAGELEQLVQEQLEVIVPGSAVPEPEPVAIAPPDPSFAGPAEAAPDPTEVTVSAAPDPAEATASAVSDAAPATASAVPATTEATEEKPAPTVTPENFWGAPTGQAGFECIVCAQRFPMAEGNFYKGALACRACVPGTHITNAERAAGNRSPYEELERLNALQVLARLFRF